MANGVLLFEGLTVGILPNDFIISINEAGQTESKLILSTAYNVIPIWIKIASDNLSHAKTASINLAEMWSENSDTQKSLLISELTPSMQVIIACGIALDALYDMLRPYSKLSETDRINWKNNKTGRAKQITEVIRRVYKLNGDILKDFKTSISQIIKFRDMGVHPSLELKNACSRSDISVLLDWKFCAYTYDNAKRCFESTLHMMFYLHEKGCNETIVTDSMNNIFAALQELKVVKRTM